MLKNVVCSAVSEFAAYFRKTACEHRAHRQFLLTLRYKALVLSNSQALLDLDELILARARADLLGMARHVKRFHDRGINVLVPAARAHERGAYDSISLNR